MIRVLLQTSDFIVVDKPSGMLVHPSRIAADTYRSLQQDLRDQLDRWVYPVHRLDRGCSGAIVFAFSPETATQLGALFQKREIEKRYWAVVRGHSPDTQVIDTPLKKYDAFGNVSDAEPQEALTRIKTLGRTEIPIPIGKFPAARYSLIEAKIETGRQHQIRRHLQRISHPLIGDTKYGEGIHNRLWREQFGLHRLLLFSRSLQFEWRGQTVRVTCPLPDVVREVFTRWAWPVDMLE